MTENKRDLVMASCQRSAALRWLKAKVSGLSDGYFELTVPKQEFTQRTSGMFNGSTISSAVDIAAGYAAVSAWDEDCVFSTVELKVNFLNPAFAGWLIACAQVLKKGKKLSVVRVDVFNTDTPQNPEKSKERMVATALVTLMKINSNKSTNS